MAKADAAAPPYVETPATGNGPLVSLTENVWVVGGLFRMMPGVFIQRNMFVLREKDELAIVLPVRLDDETEKELLKLGKIAHVVNLSSVHGCDDSYYVEKFGAKYWSVSRATPYNPALKVAGDLSTGAVPFTNMQAYDMLCAKDDAVPNKFEVVLFWKPRGDSPGLIVAPDFMQGHGPQPVEGGIDPQGPPKSFLARILFFVLGFKEHGVNKPWVSFVARPDSKEDMKKDFETVLAMDFDMIASGHGVCFASNGKKIVEASRDKYCA